MGLELFPSLPILLLVTLSKNTILKSALNFFMVFLSLILQQDLAFFLRFSFATCSNVFVSHSKYDYGRTRSAIKLSWKKHSVRYLYARKEVSNVP